MADGVFIQRKFKDLEARKAALESEIADLVGTKDQGKNSIVILDEVRSALQKVLRRFHTLSVPLQRDILRQVISEIRLTPTELKIVLFGKTEIDDSEWDQETSLLTTGSYVGRNGSPKLPTYEPNRTGSQLVDTTINPARDFLNDKEFLLQKYSVEGANLAYIARVTGLSRTAIKDRIRELGAERPEGVPILKGQVPYGWRVVNGQLVPHKGEQEIISKLVELRATGMSYGKTAIWLNENGIKTKNGGKWGRPQGLRTS